MPGMRRDVRLTQALDKVMRSPVDATITGPDFYIRPLGGGEQFIPAERVLERLGSISSLSELDGCQAASLLDIIRAVDERRFRVGAQHHLLISILGRADHLRLMANEYLGICWPPTSAEQEQWRQEALAAAASGGQQEEQPSC